MRVIENAGISDIVRELRRMLNDGIRCPDVRNKALEVMQQGDEVASIFDWARANFRYVPDPIGREWFTSPRLMLEQCRDNGVMSGDCDDASLLMASLVGSIGYNVRISVVDNSHNGEYDHALASVSTDIGWVDLDLTSPTKPMGWIGQYRSRLNIEV